jgi:lipoyl(octanoyl) transferase
MQVFHINLGKTLYNETWKLQKDIHFYKQNNKSPDIIITNEHEHVYTLGKSGDKNHLLLNDNELKENKISYYEIDRGGDLTYHGPGQLVIYPIFDLSDYYKDSHRYLRDLEQVIILTLKEYGIDADRDEQYTGVWINDEKICAIGIKITKWITMHGLAFNVNNELELFNKIIPCGIFHKGVTSMKKLLNKEIDLTSLNPKILMNFEKVFNIEIKNIDYNQLLEFYNIQISSSSQNSLIL